MASEGLKVFAESGRSDTLDAQSQGEGGVYDEFNAPPITQGEGRSEAEFFVDGNHSRVINYRLTRCACLNTLLKFKFGAK